MVVTQLSTVIINEQLNDHQWSKVQVKRYNGVCILYNCANRARVHTPRQRRWRAGARPRARSRTSVATALLINEINEHIVTKVEQNRKQRNEQTEQIEGSRMWEKTQKGREGRREERRK